MRKITLFGSLIVILMVVAGCTTTAPSNTKKESVDTLQIAATFYPLYDLTRSVAGDKAEVFSVVQGNVEPHDYETTPGDVQKVSSADVFVTMGLEFEGLEKNLLKASNAKNVNAASGIALLKAAEEDEHEEEEVEEEHEESGLDPHIWLSPKNAKIMVNNIKNGLVAADPKNAATYVSNAEKISQELDSLDQDFTKGLAQCSKDVVLVNHNAFSYLAKDYGFELITIHGLEPEAEPTPGQLQKLIEEAREHDIKYVFYEELVDPRVAQTIAREVGAETLELSPLESGSPTDTYIGLMRENLQNLRLALECN